MKIDIKNRKTLYIIIAILLISIFTLTIVYAALSTVLTINGQAEVTAASWDIYFDNIEVNEGSIKATKSPTKIDSRTINFIVGLKEPGDYYKFTVDVVNNGTIDAMIDSVIKTPTLTAQQAKYLKYEIEYTDGNSILDKQLLPKDTSKTMSVLVAYRSDVASSDIPTEGESLNLSFTMNYVQADETGTNIPELTPLVKVVSGDINTIGSEICIGEECFYLMKNDGKNIIILAKYNLLVGNIVSDSSWSTSPLQNSTGIQDASSKAGQESDLGEVMFPFIGTIEFSKTNYWENTISSYPAYVYDGNSSLYTYVENYKKYLQNLGAPIKNVRLPMFEELVEIGCSKNNTSCKSAPSWVYSTSYWTGTAYTSGYIWYTYSGYFSNILYNNKTALGIRPVVEISLQEF